MFQREGMTQFRLAMEVEVRSAEILWDKASGPAYIRIAGKAHVAGKYEQGGGTHVLIEMRLVNKTLDTLFKETLTQYMGEALEGRITAPVEEALDSDVKE
jgi:hypothetical protein